MNYYVLDSNNNITLFDIDKKRLQTTLKFKPELAEAKIHQTTRDIVELNGAYVFADEHQEEIEEQEQEKVDAEKEEALDQAIAELGKEMSKAILMGDTEWQAELQAQYNALMGE